MSTRITMKVADDEARLVERLAARYGVSRQAVYSDALALYAVEADTKSMSSAPDRARAAREFLRTSLIPVDRATAEALRDLAERSTEAHTELAKQVRYVGHNLNQLVRAVNAGRADSIDPDALIVLLAQHDELLAKVVEWGAVPAAVRKAAG